MNNFCYPHWKYNCCNKWHPGASGISAPLEIVIGKHFHLRHGTKTIPVFLPGDEEASWLLLPSLISLLLGSKVQQENTYSKYKHQHYSQLPPKHLPKSVLIDLMIQAWLVNVRKSQVHKCFYCRTIIRRLANQE